MTHHLALGLHTGRLDIDRAFFAGLAQRIDGAASFVTIEDGFAAPAGDGLDAITLANWLGARTIRLGIMPGAPVNVLEPFHVSTAIATLDYVTDGRAGVLVQPLREDRIVRARRAIGALNGFPDADAAVLAADQAEAVDVIRQLWDSWEDDAIIRDAVSQRFVDGSKLHYIRFKGARFSVLGPSITPRPPQGQPVVATSFQHGDDPAALAGSDIVFVGGDEASEVSALIGRLPKVRRPLVFADVLLSTGHPRGDRLSGMRTTHAPLAPQLEAWRDTLGLDGLRLVSADPARDLEAVLPVLHASAPLGHGSLRAQLSLPPAPNRHVSYEPVAT